MTTNTTQTTHDLLAGMGACRDALLWARDYPYLQEAWDTCERADWMAWYFIEKYPKEVKKVYLTTGYVTAKLIHRMKDKRSINAVFAAIAYGYDAISKDRLIIASKAASKAAYDAAYAADAADDAADDAYAAYDADDAADAAYAAAYAANAANAASAAANAASDVTAAAYVVDVKAYADADAAAICRKYLHI